jgi:hypothetical protein
MLFPVFVTLPMWGASRSITIAVDHIAVVEPQDEPGHTKITLTVANVTYAVDVAATSDAIQTKIQEAFNAAVAEIFGVLAAMVPSEAA